MAQKSWRRCWRRTRQLKPWTLATTDWRMMVRCTLLTPWPPWTPPWNGEYDEHLRQAQNWWILWTTEMVSTMNTRNKPRNGEYYEHLKWWVRWTPETSPELVSIMDTWNGEYNEHLRQAQNWWVLWTPEMVSTMNIWDKPSIGEYYGHLKWWTPRPPLCDRWWILSAVTLVSGSLRFAFCAYNHFFTKKNNPTHKTIAKQQVMWKWNFHSVELQFKNALASTPYNLSVQNCAMGAIF